MLKVWIYIVLMLVVLLIVFLISRVLKKIMERKRLEAEERIRKLSESEEGRTQLEKEERERSEKEERSFPVMIALLIFVYALIFAVGIAGLVGLVLAIIRGKRISEILSGGNGLYILSPLIVLVSASRLIKIFRKR